ncbi:aminopeptidase C [Paucilactobacillus hokkaidonensis JCM 18461]|uniref:Aminopeptidase n=2 Tax=Paucilactobacillus hokkaidonensis TaxID=1193095 RepID=A0A0A1GX20_9LACO|nr:C1 family peptidase [Paucilactobacillus hokkaidonensis]KRO11438.1 cysteine aminopeptidase [Paucilactobacillus hokkaidonensis]BAP85011.1 aminopeptidase C [Paucilactobacillus hokkaidonensis JCM 18461]
MSHEITTEQLKQFNQDLKKQPASSALERAVTKNGILASSYDWHAISESDPVFSIDLDTGDVSNQKQSGRCWMFAALNTMRHDMAQKFGLKKFELSQSYTFFWDKFEKANYFYENVLKTAQQPASSREVAWLMETPQQDGGQWDMLCALIEKYGVVPQSAMPETYNSSKSNEINTTLNRKLRENAITLRQLVADNVSEDQINDTRNEMLNAIYRILTYSFGQPPVKFDFEYRDEQKNYHRDADLTPQSFFKKYIGWNLDDYVSIINAPTEDKPYNRTYTIDMLGNVVGGRSVKHLNVTMNDFKQLAIDQLKAGESVWFGCDVGQSSDRQKGIMDLNIYNEAELFGTLFAMTKAQRLDYGESMMTHAMVLTGVDLVDGKPSKWKVENSWGPKVGTKGYFVMSDAWMDEFCYQIVVKKEALPDKLKTAQAQEPVLLKPWDPMGALA